MSKKSKRQEKASRANRKRFGINMIKIAEFFSLLPARIAGLWQWLWRGVKQVNVKTKDEATDLSGPVYIFGCAPTSAGDIAASYDKVTYPNIYTGQISDVTPGDQSVGPIWTDEAGDTYANNPLVVSQAGMDGKISRDKIDDYWVSYDSNTPDPDNSDNDE